MSEEESWRSDAAYDYVDKLSPGDLAWEFLRRNPEYRKSYHELIATGRLTDDVARAFAEQWGLRFPYRSTSKRVDAADFLDPVSRSRRNHIRRWAAP